MQEPNPDENINAISGGDAHDDIRPIESVNTPTKSKQGNASAKIIFFVIVLALLVGGGVYFTQKLLKKYKEQALSTDNKGDKKKNLINPEKSSAEMATVAVARPGASAAEEIVASASRAPDDGLRPLTDNDGRPITNDKGNALVVDKSGKVIEVPPIRTTSAAGTSASGQRPLPGSSGANQGTAQGFNSQGSGPGQGQAQQPSPEKFVSRYGGALFADGGSDPKIRDGLSARQEPSAAQRNADRNAAMIEKALDIAKGGGGTTSMSGTPQQSSFTPNQNRGSGGGSNAGQILANASSTPTAQAVKMPNQNLLIPKGRQADCILSTRISDEVPGFTSCVLTENLYSDDGRVLLLERGSEVSGEYATSDQQGLRRLFVTWTRAKTPNGITVDWASPGADALGGSGIPGYLDKRWFERIGAAYMLSIFKDVLTVALANNTSGTNNNGSATVLGPNSATVQTTNQMATKILEDSMKTRPVLSINQGERISIYIARDLDFSAVYSLRMAGGKGAVKIN